MNVTGKMRFETTAGYPEIQFEFQTATPADAERLHKLLTSADRRQRKRAYRYIYGCAR